MLPASLSPLHLEQVGRMWVLGRESGEVWGGGELYRITKLLSLSFRLGSPGICQGSPAGRL